MRARRFTSRSQRRANYPIRRMLMATCSAQAPALFVFTYNAIACGNRWVAAEDTRRLASARERAVTGRVTGPDVPTVDERRTVSLDANDAFVTAFGSETRRKLTGRLLNRVTRANCGGSHRQFSLLFREMTVASRYCDTRDDT